MKKRFGLVIALVLVLAGTGIYFKVFRNYSNVDTAPDADEVSSVQAVSVTPQDISQLPKDNSALGGYNVLIADRGNNRLLEITADKQIVWQYNFNLPKMGLGADDSFFTDNGKSVIVNLEEYHILQLIDYASKTVKWSYGTPGKAGALAGELNTPDDAYKLPNGDVIVTDIKNCRVIEISPDKQIVRQYGVTKVCDNKPGHLNKPNGDTPLANGHILISNINGHNLIELDENWQVVFSMNLPVSYPSDPQLTKAGNILISDYSKPGQVVEVSRSGKIIWQYDGSANDVKLNKPSLAEELPNGNVIINDDFNHRVIVVDKVSKKIVWQYGVTGKPGNQPGQLNIPDGLDIIKRSVTLTSGNSGLAASTIGSITRHAADFIGKSVQVQGYLLKQEKGYDIFSDEPTGVIGVYDLPVVGTGLNSVVPKTKYLLQGQFLASGLISSNGNLNHLQLLSAPTKVGN